MSWTFVFWEVFFFFLIIDSVSTLVIDLFIFLFLPNSVLEDGVFLKIYLFILGCTFLLAYICSNFRIFYVSVVLVVTCFSFLILFRSQFFLVSLVKGLSILFVFSKNQLLVSFFFFFFLASFIFCSYFLLLSLGLLLFNFS